MMASALSAVTTFLSVSDATLELVGASERSKSRKKHKKRK
jgi:hypothetical protein